VLTGKRFELTEELRIELGNQVDDARLHMVMSGRHRKVGRCPGVADPALNFANVTFTSSL
jgi:hypothetical protein